MNDLSQMNVLDFSAALASDLAAELYRPETIFASHGLTQAEGEGLLEQPWFAAMVEQARRDWASVDNVRDRIRIKAQITLEESLPTIYALIVEKNNPAAARVAAFKEIKEVAGMSAKENETVAGFVPVQIFLGNPGDAPITIAPGSYTRSNYEVETVEELEDETEPAAVLSAAHNTPIHQEEGFTLGMMDLE